MFDESYQHLRASTRHVELFGDGLPAEIQPYSFVPMDGMEFVASLLALRSGDTLVDMGCGRGGPGMWLASRAGAGIIGVDTSTVAVSDATSRQGLFPGLASARFMEADVAATGLPAGCADAVVAIDVLQLVSDPGAMIREIVRLLRPGGRVVVTTWEAFGTAPERFPRDIPGLFTGLSDVEVYERAEWLPRQWAMYDNAISVDDGTDPAITDLADEGRSSTVWRSEVRRLVVSASRQ